MGSHPSSNLGLGAGAGGICVPDGPFTALRLLLETRGKRSLLSARFTIGAPRERDGDAVLMAETSSPTRKVASATTAPPQPTNYLEKRRMGSSPRSLSSLVALTRR